MSSLTDSTLFDAFFALSHTAGVLYDPVCDAEGGIIDLTFARLNPAAQQLLGLPAGPVGTYLQHFPDSVANGQWAFHHAAYLATGPHELRQPHPAGDGEGPYLTAQRVGDQLLVSFAASPAQPHAVTELAAIRSELATAHAARRQWEQVFEQAPVGICVLDGPTWVYEFVNPQYQRMSQLVLQGRPLLQVLPELIGQPLEQVLHHVYATGEEFIGREVLVPLARSEDGPVEDIYFDLIYQARTSEQGIIDGLVVYAFDVTQRVLARHERDLRQQQQQTLLEQAPVAIAVYRGPRYVIELANAAMCALWDRTPAQALGTPLFELLPEAAGQGFEQLLDQVMATGEPLVAHEQPSIIERHGRRETVYWNFVYQPLREPGQQAITGVTVVATDVSAHVLSRAQASQLNQELQVTNDALHRTNARLTRVNTDLDNFIYTASHDLKAPILNIEGLLQALREELTRPAPEADPQPLLLLMDESVQRFQRTLKYLTDVTKLHQAPELPVVPVNLAALVDGICLDLEPLLRVSKGRVRLDADACPSITFAEKHLRSILYNFISNALKYRHPERAPQVQVQCHADTTGATVLEVRDNGLGLTPAQQQRVFGLFQRQHDHVEGTGIGLYLVKQVVEAVGGRAEVDSQPGAGSTFRVVLPPGPATKPPAEK